MKRKLDTSSFLKTNHSRAIEVFKAAETKAADIQEQLRKQKAIQKTQQIGYEFPDDRPYQVIRFGFINDIRIARAQK